MNFTDFWTNQNNPPKENYLYGTRHIIMLAIVLALCIVLSIIFYKKSEKVKNTLFKVFGFIFLFWEIASRVVNLIILENWTLTNVAKIILPMHICSVMVWVFIIAIFTNKQFLYNFATIGGILATLAFLLYPSVGINKVYMTFTQLYSCISHMLGFVCCVLLISLKKAKFEFKNLWKTALCFAGMFLWGGVLDFIIFPGENYMYLVKDPLEMNINFPYQIIFLGILTTYILLYYLIYELVKKVKLRK